MVDGEGGVRLYNAEFVRLFGYTPHELTTLVVDQLVAPEHVERHRGDRSRYLAEPTRRPMGGDRQLYGRHKSGRMIPLEIGLNPFELDGERLTLVSIVDITERLLAREAIAFRERHLLQVNESLSEFAYAASHDLQEPMRKVAGFCQLLEGELGESASDRARQYIGFAIDASQRMQALVRDLLEYSRVSEVQHALTAVSADDCAKSAVDLLSDTIAQTGSVVRMDALPRVRAHTVLLQQVFNNLIGNAIKYRSLDRTAEIVVSAKQDGAVWRFEVTDNGIGIDPANHERIFRVFQRLQGRDNYPGTGIGLAIVKRAIERCGGRIWVTSALGQGTSVLFTLEPAPSE
jgi:PAS domain S-box-containing protein